MLGYVVAAAFFTEKEIAPVAEVPSEHPLGRATVTVVPETIPVLWVQPDSPLPKVTVAGVTMVNPAGN